MAARRTAAWMRSLAPRLRRAELQPHRQRHRRRCGGTARDPLDCAAASERQELLAVIPPAAGAAVKQGAAGARPFGAADMEVLLPHVDLFSLNACACCAGPPALPRVLPWGRRACARRRHGRPRRRNLVGRPAAA
jgi:hypothetical protein